MAFAGVTGIAYSLLDWQHGHFGDLNPTIALRVVIPAGVLCVLGLQTIFSAFLFGLLAITVRRLAR